MIECVCRRNLNYFSSAYTAAVSAVDPDAGNGELCIKVPSELWKQGDGEEPGGIFFRQQIMTEFMVSYHKSSSLDVTACYFYHDYTMFYIYKVLYASTTLHLCSLISSFIRFYLCTLLYMTLQLLFSLFMCCFVCFYVIVFFLT